MQIERIYPEGLVVNKLPDGSTVIVDHSNETVFALNKTAGAAWEACSDATTLSGVTANMQRSLDSDVTEALAEAAILQLQEKNLVKTSGMQATRRQFIGSLGAIALPLVMALPLAEQRAHAQSARSTRPSSGSNHSSGGNHGGDSWLDWLLHLLGLE
jgi:hypothetical protein